MSSTFTGDETAPFFGFLGAAAALVFSCMGAAYGTAKSGVGVASMGVMRPELVMKSIVPVVMAGVLGIYGLIIAVIISTGINPKAKSYYLFDGYAHLSSGLACGLAGLSAGMAIGIVGDAGVSGTNSASHFARAPAKRGPPQSNSGQAQSPMPPMNDHKPSTGLLLTPSSQPVFCHYYYSYYHVIAGVIFYNFKFVKLEDFRSRANAQQPKLFVGMILILIFAEALALYGLIVGIILSSRAGQSRAE
ncbi:V-ATPase proteolipid subunit C [Trema orientale]|uniref:V-type proton ATPase proteolipid subunit n=1 Tax=Trema orientale TaxID=63057 RepID=A0A2P5EHQ3_TREOI|nr:V-ATPase proteolipid subunit C [Trema orientale]